MKQTLIVVVLIVGLLTAAHVLQPACAAPAQPTIAQRIATFVAGWFLGRRMAPREDAPPEPDLVEELPQHFAIQSGPPPATAAPGVPQLDHAAGW